MSGGQILFITDGSTSADLAGNIAMEMALTLKLPFRAVFILDEGWGNLLGDEWMSGSTTRIGFLRWLENDLNKHSEEILTAAMEKAKEKGLQIQTEVRVGKTESLITKLTVERETALMVLPNPHATAPAAAAGLRFNLNSLTKKVKCPIYIGPRC
ncbi:hypothetical protein Dred_1484 [Desulforamulus reducens MI-1]|uniref:UspA domain-containing protein n=1 Tax=Desulforamulus reducens (strain ATCC BAA-1160 / DSM 100696 / MI-1) TaxID=349161 RepID=A4J4L1_DESRM|nr:universal stress protein [Desulforamulus reducens]ABO50014.1 hypothetical protein Dred_1484 [Desulforamulus reducens MI-1]